MMRILGLEGDLFDPNSEACKKSLDRLRDVMIDAGFHVRKRPLRESTLRVYLTKEEGYPLLNPRFAFEASEDDESIPTDFIVVTVLSKDLSGAYTAQLSTFENTPNVAFIRGEVIATGYHYHGDFLIPLPVVVEPDGEGEEGDGGDAVDSEADGETTAAAASAPNVDGDDDESPEDDLEWEIDYAALLEPLREIRAFLETLLPPGQTVEP